MSIVDESVVSTADSAATCPTADITANPIGSGIGSDAVVLGLTQPLTVGEAATTSQVSIEAYALLVGSAGATQVLIPSVEIAELLLSAARSNSTLLATLNQFCDATVAAVATAALDVPQLLLSAAIAASVVTPNTVATLFADNAGAAEGGTLAAGLSEFASASAGTTATVVLLRRVDQIVVTEGDGSSVVYPTVIPATYMLIAAASGTSLVELQTNRTLSIIATATGDGEVSYKDATRVAWVMNTESSATSWYDNYDFESIAQIQDKVLAVGPDGLYQLTGDDDQGDQIDAEITSGFMDFGTSNQKHVDAVYFGYTSAGKLSVTAETQGSGHQPYTYYMEKTSAAAPENGRVEPGKGLVGRYWRFTIRNVAGAEFAVYDSSIDIAVSSRRL